MFPSPRPTKQDSQPYPYIPPSMIMTDPIHISQTATPSTSTTFVLYSPPAEPKLRRAPRAIRGHRDTRSELHYLNSSISCRLFVSSPTGTRLTAVILHTGSQQDRNTGTANCPAITMYDVAPGALHAYTQSFLPGLGAPDGG